MSFYLVSGSSSVLGAFFLCISCLLTNRVIPVLCDLSFLAPRRSSFTVSVCVFVTTLLSCCRSFDFSLISRTYRILSRDRSKRTEATGLIRTTTSKRPRGGDSRGQRPKVAWLEIG